MSILFRICLTGLAFTAATGVSSAELGRLFFTHKQRMQLEQSQQQDGKDNSLTVNGIVQKYHGARTVWINGVPQPAGASDERAPESAPVLIPGQLKPVKIKVGQRVHFNPVKQGQ